MLVCGVGNSIKKALTTMMKPCHQMFHGGQKEGSYCLQPMPAVTRWPTVRGTALPVLHFKCINKSIILCWRERLGLFTCRNIPMVTCLLTSLDFWKNKQQRMFLVIHWAKYDSKTTVRCSHRLQRLRSLGWIEQGKRALVVVIATDLIQKNFHISNWWNI